MPKRRHNSLAGVTNGIGVICAVGEFSPQNTNTNIYGVKSETDHAKNETAERL
jgi:hypothetical protein